MWRKTFNEVWVSWNHGWLQYPPWVWDRLGPYGVLLCSRSRNQTKSSAPAPINHISYTSASICASRLSSWLSIDVKNLVELSCLKPPFSPLRFWMLTLCCCLLIKTLLNSDHQYRCPTLAPSCGEIVSCFACIYCLVVFNTAVVWSTHNIYISFMLTATEYIWLKSRQNIHIMIYFSAVGLWDNLILKMRRNCYLIHLVKYFKVMTEKKSGVIIAHGSQVVSETMSGNGCMRA